MTDQSFDLKSLLAERDTEAFALHERYMNPQMPRILRTIGFDADYVRAEGAYLFDRDGRRYLDFLSGFGVFALGRCHHGIEQALRDAMDLALPNLVPARRGARAPHAGRRLPVLLHEQRRGVGRDGHQVRALRDG
jgi:4-aminobutyrate aminotransferase-like enzyme